MAAQGYQESQLDHNARSAVGAVGIMQVMPATGKELKVGDITKLDPNLWFGNVEVIAADRRSKAKAAVPAKGKT